MSRTLTGSPEASAVAVWRPSALLRFEVRHAISTKPTCGRHAHETYCIMLTERGRAQLRVGPHSFELEPRDIFVLHPGEMHHGGSAGGALEYRSVYPDIALMEDAARQVGVTPPVTFRPEPMRDSRVASLLRSVSAPPDPLASAVHGESLITEGLSRLIAEHRSNPTERPQPRAEVRSARRYIDGHLAERITLSDLARVAGLSPSYIGRLFREELGVSPHEYQIHRRVLRAKELLTEGVPLAEAATAVGFFDQAHLHRHFSKIMRITPGRYGVPPVRNS